MNWRITSVVFFVLLAAFLFLRFINTTAGSIANPTIHWNQANAFDDSATVTAMANYHENGFWSSFGLERREGMATHSLFNVPCHSKVASTNNYPDLDQLPRPMDSLTDSCVYTRTPPLHLWWDYFLFSLTHQSVQVLRISSLIFSFLALLVFYRFLLLVTAPPAALASIVFYSLSISFWGWTHALYNQPYQYFLLAIFLYLFHQPIASRKNYFFLFVTTFLLASMTNELLPFLLVYSLLASILIHRGKRTWQTIFFSVSGIAVSLGIFFVLKALYFNSFNIVWLEITSTLSQRYPVSLSGWHFFKAAYHQLITLIDQQLIPLWMLLMMLASIALKGFAAPERFKQQLPLLLIAMVCGISINVFFVQSSFYHPHLSYRHFIPLILLVAAFFFECLFRVTEFISKKLVRKTINLLTVVGICFLAHLPLLDADYRELQAQRLDSPIKHNHSDFTIHLNSVPDTVTKVQNFDKWYFFMQKNRLVDGLLYNPKLSLEQQSLTLKKNHRYTLYWYFTSPSSWSTISLYTPKGQGEILSRSCFFHDSLIASSPVAISSQGLLDRVDYQFQPNTSAILKLECKAQDLFNIIEVIW